jgi:acyl-CoA thioester hydrolase
MKHIFEQTVYYGDTDAYGVSWHGSYLRWMEQARVEFCREIGLDLVEMKKQDVMIPVTNLNIRYKASALLDERIVVETEITEMTPIMVQFTQTIKQKETGKVFTIGKVEVVAVNGQGRIYRRITDILRIPCENSMKKD